MKRRPNRRKTRTATALITATVLLMAPLFMPIGFAAEDTELQRSIPATVQCGKTIRIDIQIEWDGANELFVEEKLPAGWNISQVNHEGTASAGPGPITIQWSLDDPNIHTISYRVLIGAETAGIVHVEGTYQADNGGTQNIGGSGRFDVLCGAYRELPSCVEPGETFPVTLKMITPPNTTSWILDEAPPSGVTVSNVDKSNEGEYIDHQHHVKWLALSGKANTHTYEVSVPTNPSGTHLLFNGEYRLHPIMDQRLDVQQDQRVDFGCPEAEENPQETETESEAALVDYDDSEYKIPEVTARPLEALPDGALAGYVVSGVNLEAGKPIAVDTSDPHLLRIVVTPARDAASERIEVVQWPPHDLPDASQSVPGGVKPLVVYQVTIGDDAIKNHEITLHLRFDSDDVDRPERVVLLHNDGGGWDFAERISFRETDGGLKGSADSSCCSLFAAVIDQERPTIKAIFPDEPVDGEVKLAAQASDNLEVDMVAFYLDDKLLHVAQDAPFVFTLNTSRHENGVHQVKAEATDSAGWTASERAELTIANREDSVVTQQVPGSKEGGSTLLPIIALVAATAVVAIGYLGRTTAVDLVAGRLDWEWDWTW